MRVDALIPDTEDIASVIHICSNQCFAMCPLSIP